MSKTHHQHNRLTNYASGTIHAMGCFQPQLIRQPARRKRPWPRVAWAALAPAEEVGRPQWRLPHAGKHTVIYIYTHASPLQDQQDLPFFVWQKCSWQFFSWTKQVLLHRVFCALIYFLQALVRTYNEQCLFEHQIFPANAIYLFEVNSASWKKVTFSKGMLLYLLKRNACPQRTLYPVNKLK